MTPINLRKQKLLDGKQIFIMYYQEMGSARSIKKVIKQLGASAINPLTGRSVTDMAVWQSMYRWAMNNLDESYQIFNKAIRDEGKFHTEKEWMDFVYEKAGVLTKHSQKKLARWISRVGANA